MTCGAEIDCDDSFSMTMLVVVASVMVMFFTILSYLLFVHHFGSTKYFDRMAQVVLNKQYKKMLEEKKIGITMAKTVHENAPIKYAEVIEGMSDVEVEEETPRMESVSRLLGDSGAQAQQKLLHGSGRLSHLSADEGSMLHENELEQGGTGDQYVGPTLSSTAMFFDLTSVSEA